MGGWRSPFALDQYLDPSAGFPAVTFEVYTCTKCDVLTTLLTHARHNCQVVPEEVFQATFGSMRFERRGSRANSKVFFYTKRLEVIRRKMDDFGPLQGAGFAVVPYGEWEVSFNELPTPQHYRSTVHVALRVFNHAWRCTNSVTAPPKRAQVVPVRRDRAILCQANRKLGTWVECACNNHVYIPSNLWSCVFDYLEWTAELNHGVVVGLYLSDPEKTGPSPMKPQIPGDFQRVTERGTMPVGDWSIGVDRIPGWSLVGFRISRLLFDARVVMGMLEAMESDAPAPSFHSCRSTLDETIDNPGRMDTSGPNVIVQTIDEDREVEEINANSLRNLELAAIRNSPLQRITSIWKRPLAALTSEAAGEVTPGQPLANAERPVRPSTPRTSQYPSEVQQAREQPGTSAGLNFFRSWEVVRPPSPRLPRVQSLISEQRGLLEGPLDLSMPLSRRETESPSGRPWTSTPLARRGVRFFSREEASQNSVTVHDRPDATAPDQNMSDVEEAGRLVPQFD